MIKIVRMIGMSALAAGLGLLTVQDVARAQDVVHVTTTGNVGIGTSTPSAPLHLQNRSGNTNTNVAAVTSSDNQTLATLFETTNTGGVFSVFNSVGTETVRLSAEGSSWLGNLGIGTTNPGAKLHLFDNVDVFTVLTMQNTSSGGNGAASLHALSNSATAFFQVQGSGRPISHFGQAVASWAELLQVTGNGLIVGTLPNKPLILGTNNINRLQIDGSTGAVTIAGDLIVNGTFSNPSSRELKENFAPLDPSMVLKKFAQLPINEWSYKSDEQRLRHVGPTVEDFQAAFGLGTEGQHIFPMDVQGVTMTAVQGLYQVVQEKDAEIAELRERLAALEELVSKIAVSQ